MCLSVSNDQSNPNELIRNEITNASPIREPMKINKFEVMEHY